MISREAFAGVIFDLRPFDHAGESKGFFINHCGAFAWNMDELRKENAVDQTDNKGDKDNGKNELCNFPFFEGAMRPLDV